MIDVRQPFPVLQVQDGRRGRVQVRQVQAGDHRQGHEGQGHPVLRGGLLRLPHVRVRPQERLRLQQGRRPLLRVALQEELRASLRKVPGVHFGGGLLRQKSIQCLFISYYFVIDTNDTRMINLKYFMQDSKL